MRHPRRWRAAAVAAAGLTAVGAVGGVAEAASLSGPESPPNNAMWGTAAKGEQLGASAVSSGDVVAFWQGFLASYGNVPCPSGINGKFDANTVAGTKAIQGFFGLTKDGIVGVNTWSAAASWVAYSPYSSTYDQWVPVSTDHPEITYFHVFPSGAWKWSSAATTDFPAIHNSDTTITFTNSGVCP
jgi:hypothetical protein